MLFRSSYEYRKRLDHFWKRGTEEGGWDEDGWREEYVRPITKEVQKALDSKFGVGVYEVDVGEKGHVTVSILK